jgi:ornithine cyclodeaminase/alanine dehydrogenase-like protein (mu-crystallin family)
MVRVLTSRDLEGNVSFLEIVDAVEAGYRASGEGRLVARPRNYLTAPGLHTTLSVSPAVSPELGVGVFAYTGGNKGKGLPQKLAVLFDPADGGLACLIESAASCWRSPRPDRSNEPSSIAFARNGGSATPRR